MWRSFLKVWLLTLFSENFLHVCDEFWSKRRYHCAVKPLQCILIMSTPHFSHSSPPSHPLSNFIRFSVNKQTKTLWVQQGLRLHEPPLPSLLELWLTWSCADYHSCCDSWAEWLTAVSCPEDRISHLSFLVSSSNIPWALGQGEVDQMSYLGLGIHGHLFSALWVVRSLCTNHCHYSKELLWPWLRVALIIDLNKYFNGNLTS